MADLKQRAHDADTEEAFRLYERYGKPLEAEHRGEYLAVSPDGHTILGKDLLSTMQQATKQFGPDNVVFKIGDVAVGTWL